MDIGGSSMSIGKFSGGGGGNGGSNKRPVLLNGISSTVEEKNIDFICPICFDLIVEAHITRCGHTFCYQCILQSIETYKRCPKCNSPISSIDQIFPNYLLGELICKHRQLIGNRIGGGGGDGDISNETFGGTSGGVSSDGFKTFITSESEKLELPDVNVILEILSQRKQQLEAESSTAQNRLLHEFLQHLLRQKKDQVSQINKEIDLVTKDINCVETILNECKVKLKPTTVTTAESNNIDVVNNERMDSIDCTEDSVATNVRRAVTIDNVDGDHLNNCAAMMVSAAASSVGVVTSVGVSPFVGVGVAANGSGGSPPKNNDEGFNSAVKENAFESSINFISRKRRMHAHFEDFVKSYFTIRGQDLYYGNVDGEIDSEPGKTTTTTATTATQSARQGLDVFRENLVKFSKYNTLRPLATMNYSSDLHNNSTIVSTIVFDKDNEYFAIGGVTKRIKIFDYLAVIRDTVDIHYPSVEMISNSKISCIAWNSYHKNLLASSDYDGAVNIWDVQTGRRSKSFHEHEKRCWSVDFNNVDTRLIASGSDDARVKLWSTNDENSIATLEAKANVCCVKFNPNSSCHLAFGSADHDVHYYDLRNMNKALCVFKGHKKAVSYVKFLNTEEIISASTDSQLKLWSIKSPPYCLRTFVGHVNEKNFVGLATDGDYIACGSEDNSLYVYYKGLSKRLFNFKIDGTVVDSKTGPGNQLLSGGIDDRTITSGSGGGGIAGLGAGSAATTTGTAATAPQSGSSTTSANDSSNEFVSAVCWRKKCNVVLAANSRGLIKILELV